MEWPKCFILYTVRGVVIMVIFGGEVFLFLFLCISLYRVGWGEVFFITHHWGEVFLSSQTPRFTLRWKIRKTNIVQIFGQYCFVQILFVQYHFVQAWFGPVIFVSKYKTSKIVLSRRYLAQWCFVQLLFLSLNLFVLNDFCPEMIILSSYFLSIDVFVQNIFSPVMFRPVTFCP